MIFTCEGDEATKWENEQNSLDESLLVVQEQGHEHVPGMHIIHQYLLLHLQGVYQGFTTEVMQFSIGLMSTTRAVVWSSGLGIGSTHFLGFSSFGMFRSSKFPGGTGPLKWKGVVTTRIASVSLFTFLPVMSCRDR